MNNSQSKTRGVLAAEEIEVIYARWHCGSAIGLARDIEAAVLAKAASQSPVAPADERESLDGLLERIDIKAEAGLCQMSHSGARGFLKDVRELVKDARARLADAPTVSATDHPLTFALGVLTEIAQSARQDKEGGYQAGGVRWGDIESARRAVSAMLNVAPTPPTSAADAHKAGMVEAIGICLGEIKHYVPYHWDREQAIRGCVAAIAKAASKESGDE